MALSLDKIIQAGSNTVSVGKVVFSNSNGMSIGLSSNTMTFGYSVPTDYISSNQSSLFQQTSAMSAYQQTSLMSNYLNTSVSSQFQQTSAMSAYQQTSLMSNYLNTSVSSQFQQTSATSAITSNALNTSQSSLFQQTSGMSAYQQTSLMSNYLNTSVSSQFQQTSATSAITSNALNTSQSSLFQQTSGMSNYLGTTASLNNLADVVVSSATLNQILKYNGANWVNGDNVNNIGAGNGVVMFFDETPSGVSTYDTIAPTPDTAPEVDLSATVNNSTVLIQGFSTSTGIGRTVIDAGVWDFNVYTYVSNTTPTSTLVFNVYSRTTGGTETLLFSIESDPITFTSIDVINFSSVQPQFSVNTTDFLVVKVYAKTTALVNVDVHFLHSGTDHYSHVHTPLFPLHNDLAGLQGGAINEYYHFNSADYSNRNVSATSVYQLTANMSNYQATSLMSNYLNTSVSSQFQQTSAMSAYQQTSLMSNYANNTVSMYATGNTTQVSSGSQVLGSLLFRGAGAASVGMSNGSIVISASANTGIVIDAGTSVQKLDTLSFSNANGVSFGLNLSTITASVETAYAASTHTHGNPTLFLTNLSGSTASASNGLTLSLSAAAPGAGTYTALTYNNRQLGASTNSIPGQNSVWLAPMYVGQSVYASTGLHMVSLTGSVTSNQTNTVAYTWEGAIYKVTGTNASRYDTVYSTSLGFTFWNSGTASVSYSYNVTSGSSAGSNLMTASVYGLRQLTFNIGSTFAPGEYAWGFRQSSASSGNSSILRSFNAVMDNPLPTAMGFVGSATNNSIGYVEAGTYSVTSGAMPASFVVSQVIQTLNVVPYFKMGAV